jgi:hypothetical protein
LQLHLYVQHVDDQRGNTFNTRVHSSCEPSRPAPLGSPGHDKSFDRGVKRLLDKRLYRIHAAHGAFNHRKQQRPGLIVSLQVLVKGISYQRIFCAIIKGLIRNIHDDRCHGTRTPCKDF